MSTLLRLALTLAVAVVAACGIDVLAQGSVSALADCTVPALQAKAPEGTTITAAKLIDAAGKLPKYCQVDGHTATTGNEVNFRIGLPERWNGKYYFVGVGGLGGSIGSLNKGLERGYATASTDTGH